MVKSRGIVVGTRAESRLAAAATVRERGNRSYRDKQNRLNGSGDSIYDT